MEKDKFELVSLRNKEDAEIIEERQEEPKDNKNIVYLIILLHGIGTLMPWNLLINISYDYYENYKMLNNASIDYTNGKVTGTPSVYSENFQSYQTISSQLPNLILNLLNIFVAVRGGLVPRITVSMVVVASCVISIMSFIYVDTSSWTSGFFALTILTIIVLNGANGVYQNSIFGLASDFPFKYTNAVIIGNNLCGTFVTVLSMVTKMITNNVLDRAFSYFAISLLTVGLCVASFFILKKQPFYQYHARRAEIQRSEVECDANNKLSSYITFREAFPQLVNVYLVFFVTLSVFPGVMMYVKDAKLGETHSFIVPEKYFMDVTTFLVFNVFAFIGSMVAGKVQYPKPSRLWIPVYARLLFIFLFAFCNYLPESRTMPVFFPSTWMFVIFGVLMSFTSGYYSSLAMMYTPRSVHPSRAQTASMMAGFVLISGIVSGLMFTMVIKMFVTI